MTDYKGTVLLTDRAWPDDAVERDTIEAAGFRLVSGPPDPAPATIIEALVAQHQPAAILTCWAPVSTTAIASAMGLQVVARMGVGLDNIAVTAATHCGVLVTNVPDYCVEEVSDHAVGLVLAWARGLVAADREVRAGHWNPGGSRLRRLSSLTCGVVGFGRIGRVSAAKLRALGARVVASTPTPPADTRGVPILGLDELLASSDVVVLHAPLTVATHHLIGARELALMKPGTLLINVSRGGLVDTEALIASLRAGHLGGAGLDVLEEEPGVPVELLEHPSVVITHTSRSPRTRRSSNSAAARPRKSSGCCAANHPNIPAINRHRRQ